MMHLDTLVRGRAGFTEKTVEGRVYRVSPHGWVAVLSTDQRQWVIHEPEVVDAPRPVNGRNVPSRLQ